MEQQFEWTPAQLKPEGYNPEETEKNPWIELYAARQNRTIIEGVAAGIEEHNLHEETIPCLVVMFDHIKGLIPLPESGVNTRRQMERLVGLPVSVKVIGIMREENLVLLSRKQALEHMFNVTWPRLEVGKIEPATVRGFLGNPGYKCKIALLDVTGVPGYLFADDASWSFIDDMREEFAIGQSLRVKIIKKDEEKKRVRASLKELLPDPWPSVPERFKVGNSYVGRVSGVVEYGVYVNLSPGVDVLSRHMPFVRVRKGDRVTVRINRIDTEKRRIRGTIIKKL